MEHIDEDYLYEQVRDDKTLTEFEAFDIKQEEASENISDMLASQRQKERPFVLED